MSVIRACKPTKTAGSSARRSTNFVISSSVKAANDRMSFTSLAPPQLELTSICLSRNSESSHDRRLLAWAKVAFPPFCAGV